MKLPINVDLNLRRNSYSGLYIAVEGIDGCGKTTQTERLKRYFEDKGRKVVMTSEPTEKLIIGKFIREKILPSKVKIPSTAFQFLYSADRVINHSEIVEPALKRGEVVLSHRAFLSTPAYGMIDRGEKNYSNKTIMSILIAQGTLSTYHQFIMPDKTFYLDVSIDEALKRLSKRNDGKAKYFYERRGKMEEVLRGYRWLAKKFSNEIVTVDGGKSVEEVTETIIKLLN